MQSRLQRIWAFAAANAGAILFGGITIAVLIVATDAFGTRQANRFRNLERGLSDTSAQLDALRTRSAEAITRQESEIRLLQSDLNCVARDRREADSRMAGLELTIAELKKPKPAPVIARATETVVRVTPVKAAPVKVTPIAATPVAAAPTRHWYYLWIR